MGTRFETAFLLGVLANSGHKRMVGGHKHKAALRHLMHALCEARSKQDKSAQTSPSLRWAEMGGYSTHSLRDSSSYNRETFWRTRTLPNKKRKKRPSEQPGQYTKARYKAWDKANKKRAAAGRKITHGIVYKLTSPSGKSYIGISKYTIERRILWHKSESSRCWAIKAALKKYGFAAFKKEVLHSNIPLESLPTLEMHEIAAHGTMAPNGYNLTRGGEYNPMDEPATRKKISDFKTNWWKSHDGSAAAAKMQEGDARARATATNLARWWERAKAKAASMDEAAGEKYLAAFLKNRARRQAAYRG